MKSAIKVAIVTFLFSTTLFAAPILTIDHPQFVAANSSFSSEIVISDLGNMRAPSLGSFDIALCFNPNIVRLDDFDFGDFLGDAETDAVTGLSVVNDNLVIFEVSLLLPQELVDLQPSSFTLLTLDFEAIAEGDFPFAFILNAPIGDENGDFLHVNTIDSTLNVLGEGSCVPNNETLCLNEGRFRVEVVWRDFDGNTGAGKVVTASGDSGLMWFFASDNWEMLIKVLDGCSITNHFWVFAAATTNVEFTLRVTDTETGGSREYFNPLGVSASAITDTSALNTCP